CAISSLFHPTSTTEISTLSLHDALPICLDLVDDAEVRLEVALGEARVVLAPVVVGEVLGGADRPGEEAVPERRVGHEADAELAQDRKSTRLNSSHVAISYAVFCLKKKKQ